MKVDLGRLGAVAPNQIKSNNLTFYIMRTIITILFAICIIIDQHFDYIESFGFPPATNNLIKSAGVN